MGFLDRLQHGWNAFMNKDPTQNYQNYGMSYSYPSHRPRLTRGNERSIVNAIFNRIAMDVSAIDVRHCRIDGNGRFIEDITSNLNNCLNLEANIDQTGRAFMQDVVMSMLDEGVVAIVPIDTVLDPKDSGSLDILSMRTGKIIEWFPAHVKVRVYNDRTGNKEDIMMPKSKVAIIENPFYSIINEPNSTMQRLMRKLSLLDIVDEQTGAGKLDLIIQLPYVIKSEARRAQAENRRKDIEMQLSGSKYGIAYTDGTERITQLNRPLENNLLKQIEYLTNMLYSQLGFHQTILDGTADEKTMLNYTNSTIEPIISAIVDEMKRKFLTKTARTQNQTITFFRDPFKLVPINNIADIADKFTRNEILTSNEVRQIVGMKPSNDPKADQLINSNINQSNDDPRMQAIQGGQVNTDQMEYDKQSDQLDELDLQLDSLESQLQQSGMTEDDFLAHYSSKYYDPIKAHQYYMEYTKKGKLKGRNSNGESEETEYSTSMLNDEGKAAYKQIKEALANEKTQKINSSKESMNSGIEASKNELTEKLKAEKEKVDKEIESHVKNTQSQIEQVQKIISEVGSKQGGNGLMEALQNKIAKLREENSKKREALNATYQNTSANLRQENASTTEGLKSAHKATTEAANKDYDQSIKDELRKLIDSGEFKKVVKKKSGKSSSK